MKQRIVVTVLVALMLVLAGCAGSTQGPGEEPSTSEETLQPTTGTLTDSSGTLVFYVSDQPAAIEDFDHLNVTIDRVGLKPTGDDDDLNDANETDDANVSGYVNETNVNETDLEDDVEELSDDDESEMSEDDENEKDGWVTYEVDNRTVDLTELKGANATRLANLNAPNGTYSTVFVYVSSVEGQLTSGEDVRVKLPSEKLQLHSTIEIGPNSTTEFVYDIAVHKAGKSGKYILKPNIAESGTDVEIRNIDREREEMEEADRENDIDEVNDVDEDDAEPETDEPDDDQDEDDTSESPVSNETSTSDNPDPETVDELAIKMQGNVSPGENVTVAVTDSNGTPVAGATVSINSEEVGITDSDGQIEITIPEAGEVTVEVTKADREAEMEIEFNE